MVEFYVLRCAHCQTFQVQQVTKAKKWKCKLCGEKQSVLNLKVYGSGTGADCRRHVQKLNSLRGEIEAAAENTKLDSAYHNKSISSMSSEKSVQTEHQSKTGYWDAFIEKETRQSDEDDYARTERGEEKHNGILVTTDWSVLQNDQRHNWKRRKELHHNRWNKRAKHEGSSHSSDDVPPNIKLRNNYKNYGKDLYERDNSCSASHNQTTSLRSIFSANRSIDFFTTAEATVNSSVKNATYYSCGKKDSSSKTGLQNSFDLPTLHEYTFNPAASRVTSTSIENKANSYHLNSDVSSKSSKWTSFVTTTNVDGNEDSNDEDSLILNDSNSTLLPSFGRKPKMSTKNCVLPSSSKWSTFLNYPTEEEDDDDDDNIEYILEHNDFFPQSAFDNVVNDKTVSTENIFIKNPSRDSSTSRDNVVEKSSLFQLGDEDESCDLDL